MFFFLIFFSFGFSGLLSGIACEAEIWSTWDLSSFSFPLLFVFFFFFLFFSFRLGRRCPAAAVLVPVLLLLFHFHFFFLVQQAKEGRKDPDGPPATTGPPRRVGPLLLDCWMKSIREREEARGWAGGLIVVEGAFLWLLGLYERWGATRTVRGSDENARSDGRPDTS